MNNLSRGLWGVLLIVIGVILGLNVLGITNIDLFFDGWWTLFIIVPSFIGLFQDKEERISNVIGLCIGIALLLAAQDIIKFETIFKLMVPFVLVVVGLSILFRDGIKKKVTEKFKEIRKGDLESIVAMFAEQKLHKDDESFKGANLDVVFGSVSLDLRKANLGNETVIKASSIFGGIDIMLPDDVNVHVKATPIFGGVSNKLRNHKDNKKNIYIDAFCLFGGVDIK